MINRHNGTDTDRDTKSSQDGIDHMDGTGEVIAVEKVTDRCGKGDTRHQGQDRTDDGLIVQERKSKLIEKQAEAGHKGTSQNIYDKARRFSTA